MRLYKEALMLTPTDPLLYNEFGKLLRKQNNTKMAIQVFRRGIAVDERCAALHKVSAHFELPHDSPSTAPSQL